ncbi:MAG: HAMP domain-containing sensor histidine kinase [Acidobacteria bacterium]|nr:HAMP domain-containing sensor histidine kinase [Acidobacteriota bacterium]
MSERAWFRSLYWRIAIGFVAFLAALMVVQGAVTVWFLARSSDAIAGRSTLDLAALVASDLGTAWSVDENLDVEAYLREHYGSHWRPVALVLPDGRVLLSQPGAEVPPLLRETALRRLIRSALRPGAGAGPGAGPGPGRGGRQGMGPGAGLGPGRPAAFYPVVVQDRVRAMVLVPPNAPLAVIIRQVAPVGLAIAALLVLIGTMFASVFIFRPAHKRLGQLEEAAKRLGTGDATARAPESGGDEIAAVARAFNRMAADLSARADALQTADHDRRQLLADVSHELMTPLTAIRGYLETLAMAELALNADTRQRYLGIVREETARLERLIGDLMDLARLEAGGGALVRTEMPVDELFRRVIERHERDAGLKHVTLTSRITPPSITVHVDPVRMEQAIQNLAANALRHTGSGGSIELVAGVGPDTTLLSVRDTGEGIPAAHIGHVFDRFYKADNSRAGDQRGSGLGLSIVKAIVERHGGRITVRSQEGLETVFEIELPRQPPSMPAAASASTGGD